MLTKRIPILNLHVVITIAILLMLTVILNIGETAGPSDPTPTAVTDIQPIIWGEAIPLPTQTCHNSGSRDCQRSSPALEDINEDGFLDIVVATNAGHILVVEHDGHILWDRDVSSSFGMAPNTQELNSSPAVADIDADGHMEIVVGAGTLEATVCTQGGLIVLDHLGNVESGWPQLAEDWASEPTGCRDSIFASPALGDMDNDGDLEIVAGGFDNRIYAWHHDGTLLPGYSPDSWLYERFNWGVFEGHLADPVWSSPALVDLDSDGFLDLLLATTEGNQGGGWVCPYQLPPGWRDGYCGGAVYALNRFGGMLPGWPRHFLEVVHSVPAIADLDEDGYPDIIMGKGYHYYSESPDQPTYGFVLHAMDRFGNDLPDWAGGRQLGGPATAAPAVGDIAGDSRPEVIMASSIEKKLYAWHADGQLVNGFPMTPVDLFGDPTGDYAEGQTFLLADTDGDDKMEIVTNLGWVVAIVDGDGTQLTAATYPGNPLPIYYAEGSLMNSPAVGDIDNDGQLELIAFNRKLYAWDLGESSAEADWPMLKLNAAGNPVLPQAAFLDVSSDQLLIFKDPSEPGPAQASFLMRNLGGYPMDWSSSALAGVTLSPNSGVLEAYAEQVVEVTIYRAALSQGMNEMGTTNITAFSNGQPVLGSPASMSVAVYFGTVHEQYVPILER